MLKDKKGQTGGLITSLVFGVAALVIGVIIAFVIVSTLDSAELLTETRGSLTATNESSTFANSTGDTLNLVNATNTNYILTAAWNATTAGLGTYNLTIPLTNLSLGSTTGIIKNGTAVSQGYYANISVTYTYSTFSPEELAQDKLSANFTSGVDNVSEKIPTVLLIAAIVLILGILAVLVGVWQKMRMGGGSI